MIAKVLSGTVTGIDASLVEVEVDISSGLPVLTTVGLPEASVRESRERVRSAIRNSGYLFPDDRITVNLAPASVKKEGTGFDLPMALGILAATKIIRAEVLSEFLILGELSLDGRVKPVRGSLPMSIAAKDAGYRGIIVPYANRREASVVQDLSVFAVKNLAQAVGFLLGTCKIAPQQPETSSLGLAPPPYGNDFSEIMGQEHAKRAMEIAAAGGHNLLMTGPPGSGKTMLARSLPSILPPLTSDEAIETTKVHSVAGLLAPDQALVMQRPFRAPHHTISDAGLIGGGHVPRPGEVSLAHNGILFLDELPEFKKHVLEVLRQPLEDRRVTISRAATALTYPSSFIMVAAMNPCPCGYSSDPARECRCTLNEIQRYGAKISGPLLDRIDLHVQVPAVPVREIRKGRAGEPSEKVRERVIEARRRQSRRFDGLPVYCNAQMESRMIREFCPLDRGPAQLLELAMEKLGLSARAYNRIIKLARTIADLAGEEKINENHLSEAVQYRDLDRNGQFT